jgi:hypothetical protein
MADTQAHTPMSAVRGGPVLVIVLAMLEVDDRGNSATWGEHVTDQEYNATAGRQASQRCGSHRSQPI